MIETVAEWLTPRSAKPGFAGSIPARLLEKARNPKHEARSKLQAHKKKAPIARLELFNFKFEIYFVLRAPTAGPSFLPKLERHPFLLPLLDKPLEVSDRRVQFL